jgi:Uma2 family endonuclease
MATVTTVPLQANRRSPQWQWSGAVAIPLSEFGKSLADPDLDRWFEAFSGRNENEGQYEMSSGGCLLIMPPTGNPGSIYEGELVGAVFFWAQENDGVAFGPTSLFILPDGSRSSPDAAWVREERRREIFLPENLPFPHIVPDFIAEIKSPSNTRAGLIAKIGSFIQHGTRLAWYIDPETREVIKLRPDQEPEVLHDPEYIDGDDDVLPGFRFTVRQRIFDVLTTFQQQEVENAAGEQGSPD